MFERHIDLANGAYRLRPFKDGDDPGAVCNLVNEVYRVAERGIWKEEKDRVSVDDFVSSQSTGTTLVAYQGEKLAGTIHFIKTVTLSESSTVEDSEKQKRVFRFEKLAVDPSYRGSGLGAELVRAVESIALEEKASSIEFELLVSKGWKNESKDKMQRWYSRLGFIMTGVKSVEAFVPQSVKFLENPAEFQCWEKNL